MALRAASKEEEPTSPARIETARYPQKSPTKAKPRKTTALPKSVASITGLRP
jgi:hypothetical protein